MDVDIANRVIELDSLVLFTILQHLSATTDLKSVACVNSGCRAAAAVRGSPSPPNAATPSQSWSPTARESLTRALDSPVRRMWRPTRSSPCSSSWPRCRPLAGKQYARLRTSRSWLHGAPSRLAPSCGCARHPARSSWTRAATSSAGKTLVAVTTTPLLAAGSGRRHISKYAIPSTVVVNRPKS